MPLGIYVHLPFCPYICPYCDFAKWPMRRSQASRYLVALAAEIDTLPREPAATIFFGGGTPNTYAADEIAALLQRLREHYSLPSDAEVTLEANPELVDPASLRTLRDAGVSRLSIGVQSFVPEEIVALGRRHTPAMVRDVVAQARAAGFVDVSLDLIFAAPGQTIASWERSLAEAISLDADHISTYGLTVEDGTPYAAWREREPAAFASEDLEADLYERAMRRLTEAGYEQYEISNFTRPGHRCRHNENYWANGEYVGIGVGAASYRNGTRSVHTRNLETYVEAALAGGPIPGEAERLEGEARTGEAIMLALRTAAGVNGAAFRERYGVDVERRYSDIIGRYEDAGLLERADGWLRLTERGRPVANDVCGAFLSFE